MISQSKWKWFGHAGHFICGRWCRFHLCTQVGEYLVSTVGEYVHPSRSGANEQVEAKWLAENWPGEDIGININRKYETMVFMAGKPCEEPKCGCGLPKIDGNELDTDDYNTAGAASRGHMRMCIKWAKPKQKV